MKWSLLLGLFCLTGCTWWGGDRPDEAFIAKEKIEMKSIDAFEEATEVIEEAETIEEVTALSPEEDMFYIPPEEMERVSHWEDGWEPVEPTVPKVAEATGARPKGLPVVEVVENQMTVIYFFDYTAEKTKELESVVDHLTEKYGSKVLWLYRPVGQSIGARMAARASYCAQRQGIWGLHEDLLDLETFTEKAILQTPAIQLSGMGPDLFKPCLYESATIRHLDNASYQAQSRGIDTLPAFMIGNGVVLSGDYPKAMMRSMLETFVASQVK